MVDNEHITSLLYDIEERGENLTRWEIDFVADLVDEGCVEFTPKQARAIERIHAKRVT